MSMILYNKVSGGNKSHTTYKYVTWRCSNKYYMTPLYIELQ